MRPFQPTGPCVLVDDATSYLVASGNTNPNSYRVRNKGTAEAWFSWASGNNQTSAPAITVTAPVAGTPSPRTFGMLGSSVETFYVGQNMWFKASTGASFEITPGLEV